MISPARPDLASIRRNGNGNGHGIAPVRRELIDALPAPASGAAGIVQPEVDLDRAARAVRDLLIALGEDPNREGLEDTPRRVVKAMAELMAGRFVDPAVHLGRTFEHRADDVVMLKDIEFFSLCEHHLLPFIGKASVAYLPEGGRVVGLSKLARLVEVYARRPQMQERMTQEIADALMHHVRARGAAVVVQAEHMCMKMRGVGKTQPFMQTVALRGAFRDNPDMRKEILALLSEGAR